MYGTNEKNVPQSLASVQEVVKGIQTKPVTDQELEDARNTLINSLAVSLETNEKVAGLLIDIEYFNLGKNYLQELPVIYSQITKEDLLRVAQKYIHMDKTTQVITGPHKE
jgi:zinc protease